MSFLDLGFWCSSCQVKLFSMVLNGGRFDSPPSLKPPKMRLKGRAVNGKADPREWKSEASAANAIRPGGHVAFHE